MPDLPWDDVKEWFNPDENGSAPDVMVAGTTLADWEALIALIRSEGWRCEYVFHDRRLELPSSAAELLVPDPGWTRSLWVWPDPEIELIFRVWSVDEIVGDVSLFELHGQERLDRFCGILRRLGRTLGKRVVMYAEGAMDDYPPMLAYDVDYDRVVFLAGPWRE